MIKSKHLNVTYVKNHLDKRVLWKSIWRFMLNQLSVITKNEFLNFNFTKYPLVTGFHQNKIFKLDIQILPTAKIDTIQHTHYKTNQLRKLIILIKLFVISIKNKSLLLISTLKQWTKKIKIKNWFHVKSEWLKNGMQM